MRLTVIVLALVLALPGVALAADTGPTPSSPSPAPPTASTPTAATPTTTGTTPTTAAPAPAPTAPAAAAHHGSSTGTWLLAILAALVVLSAVFAGLAWWFGWSAERFVGRGGASWRSLEEFGDWIRTGH